MIQRLYVNNFRCFENFELNLADLSSVLLIGKNGAGKTTVLAALRVLQKAARGTNRVRDLVGPADLTRSNSSVPMRFEIDLLLDGKAYRYSLALELPNGFRELRIFEESLTVDEQVVYSRAIEHIKIAKSGEQKEASFIMDWHQVALPVIQSAIPNDPVKRARIWLSQMLLLRPIPQLISGDSTVSTLQPCEDVSDLGAWFTGLINQDPSAYITVDDYLKQVLKDFDRVQNLPGSNESRRLQIHFSSEQSRMSLALQSLSDGEKCFVLCALVIASQQAYGPVFCFWDEPDNFLALSEVGHFVLALRKALRNGGQFIATSHNPEAIRRFSRDTTLLLQRRSHMEPSLVKAVGEMSYDGDLVGALLRDELY